jgi:hypothetical protein
LSRAILDIVISTAFPAESGENPKFLFDAVTSWDTLGSEVVKSGEKF